MDYYVRDMFNGEADKRDAVRIESYHWKNWVIFYEFDPHICQYIFTYDQENKY